MLSNSYDLCGCMVSCKRSLWINKIRVAILLSAEFRRSIVATFSMEFCTKEFHLPRSNNTQQSRHPQPPGAPKDDATAATAATLRSYAQLHRRPIRPVVHPVVRPRSVATAAGAAGKTQTAAACPAKRSQNVAEKLDGQ